MFDPIFKAEISREVCSWRTRGLEYLLYAGPDIIYVPTEFIKSFFQFMPADTRRINDVIITPKRRRYVVLTL